MIPSIFKHSCTVFKRNFHVAIIGSGPSGFYTAIRISERIKDAKIDMYERLPVPYGLVRYGVAPDHPEVKNVEHRFEEFAKSPNFTFVGNMNVGEDIPMESILQTYNALVFSFGASHDRELGLQNEFANGVYSARAFVGWYNGLPEYKNLQPDLTRSENAIIIGHGNVGLDIARMLLSNVNDLAKTDIADYALEALKTSKVKNVRLIGRRGPLQIRELIRMPGVRLDIAESNLVSILSEQVLPRRQKRLIQLLSKTIASPTEEKTHKSWALDYLQSPKTFELDSQGNLKEATFEKSMLVESFDGTISAKGLGEYITYPTSLVFKSIGYKGESLRDFKENGIPFNPQKGIIPNINGRVIDDSEKHIEGVYTSGWVKRGPTGVIATTMADAFETADAICDDYERNSNSFRNTSRTDADLGWTSLAHKTDKKSVTWDDWKQINKSEICDGWDQGRPRRKICDIDFMLQNVQSR